MRRRINQSFILLTCILCLALQLCGSFIHSSFATGYPNGVEQMTPEQWRQLTSDKAFNYKDAVEKPPEVKEYTPGAWEKALTAFFRFWKSNTGVVLMWILVGILASWLIYKIFIQKDSFLFGKSGKSLADDSGGANDEQDLASTNWETLLQHAADNKDFRLAIRYSYMWLLQMLQQRSLIQYRIDKTNYEYYKELAETSYKQPFRQLSRQYEYVWYGRFDLSQATYAEYKQLFDHVKQQIGG